MKNSRTILICLASGLALNSILWADTAWSLENPYTPIISRNIFGLNPPQPVAPVEVSPPQKITATGIMTIFGNRQVLFKVAGVAKPGQPAKETSYILSEGQRQDNIEVTSIDEKSEIVTFNNSGNVQQIPLTKTPTLAIPVSTPVTSGINPQPRLAGAAPSGGNNGIGLDNRFGGGGRNRGGNNAGADNGSKSVPTPPPIQQSRLTLEEAVVAIELNREITKQEVIEGNMPPLPPTEMTPPDATSVGGGPLVAPQ